MNYKRITPSSKLSRYVAWYWCAESQDVAPKREKIIPDGYPEFVFHHGHPYRIRLHDRWQTQGPALFGGQIRQHFFLENTGLAGIFGITFHATAPTHLFGLDMHRFTDQVIDLHHILGPAFRLSENILQAESTKERIEIVEDYLGRIIPQNPVMHPVDRALNILKERKGLISMEELSDQLAMGNRQVQRLFQRYVGLAPKFYARIIRFNIVFEMIKQATVSWADIVHASGYYDQSHFIRNFKAFTGEDPSAYGFQVPTLTNFFTQKSNSTMSDLYNTPVDRSI